MTHFRLKCVHVSPLSGNGDNIESFASGKLLTAMIMLAVVTLGGCQPASVSQSSGSPSDSENSLDSQTSESPAATSTEASAASAETTGPAVTEPASNANAPGDAATASATENSSDTTKASANMPLSSDADTTLSAIPATTSGEATTATVPSDSPAPASATNAETTSTTASSPTTPPLQRPDLRALTGNPPPVPPSRPRLVNRVGGNLNLSFDDLEFPIQPDQDFERSMMTPKIEELNGKKVIIRGFILGASVYDQTGITEFVLVRDNLQCCFGPTAYVYHNIQVEMAEGATANYSERPVAVTGTLTIKPWYGPDKKCYSVYHISATSVK